MWTEAEIHNTNHKESPIVDDCDLGSHPLLKTPKTQNDEPTALEMDSYNAMSSSQEGAIKPPQVQSDLFNTRDPPQAGTCITERPDLSQNLSTETNTILEMQGRHRDQKGDVNYYAKLAAKQTLIFLRSCVGLLCLLILYSLLGAVIFRALESPRLEHPAPRISDIRKMRVKELWDTTISINVFDGTQWTKMADKIFMTYQMEIHKLVKDRYWNGSDTVRSLQKPWTFAHSLLYSVSIITTIGYGNLAAQTTWGRCVTMLYAALGIPLTLLCLTSIGSFLAQHVRFLWKKILYLSFKNCSRHRSTKTSSGHDLSHPNTPAGKSYRTDLQVGESIPQNSASSGQDGSGSISPDTDQRRDSSQHVHHWSKADQPKPNKHQLQNQTEMTTNSSPPQPVLSQNTIQAEVSSFPNSRMDQRLHPVQPDVPIHTERSDHSSHTQAIIFQNQGQTEQHPVHSDSGSALTSLNQNLSIKKTPEPEEPGNKSYPEPKNSSTEDRKMPKVESMMVVTITICLMVAVVYIILGAVLFSLWQGWSFFSSFYFCVISLSTIGFGDLLPGYELTGKDNEAKQVICVCYLLLGLVLVAMCFELICLEVRHKFQGLVCAHGTTVQEKED